jgi:hypothetical protein
MTTTTAPVVRRRCAARSPFVLTAALAAAGAASGAFAGEVLSIRTIAPEKSILVVGIDDLAATRARFDAIPLGGWWKSPEVQEKSKSWREELEKNLEAMTQELGVPRESVQWPASAGLALSAELNEETGLYEPAFIGFVDWGKEAENFGKLYDAGMAKLEKDKTTPFTIEEIKGRRVYVLEQAAAPEAGADGADGDDEDGDMALIGDLGIAPTKLWVTRDAGRLLVSASAAGMSDVLGVLDGDKRPSVADTDDFKGAMELVKPGGEGRGAGDAYAVLLTAPAQQLVGALGGPEFALAQPFLAQLFGDVRGYAFNVALDAPFGGSTAQLASSIGIYAPGGKVGLLSLLPAGVVDKVPSIIPADAMSYAKMNVQFSGVMKVIDDVVNGLPEEMRDGIRSQLEPFDPIVRPALGGMGPGIHVWSTLKQPITAESQSTMTAINVGDPKAVQGLFQFFGPQAGLAPRDFLGNTIYAGDEEFMPFAAGFGGSYLFMGSTDGVEQSLRGLGQKDAGDSIEGDAVFKAAMGPVQGDDLVGYGYTNTILMLEAQQLAMDEIFGVLAEADVALGQDLPGDVDANLDGLFDLLKPELLKNYLGPSAWQFRSVKNGFRFDSQVLGPTK